MYIGMFRPHKGTQLFHLSPTRLCREGFFFKFHSISGYKSTSETFLEKIHIIHCYNSTGIEFKSCVYQISYSAYKINAFGVSNPSVSTLKASGAYSLVWWRSSPVLLDFSSSFSFKKMVQGFQLLHPVVGQICSGFGQNMPKPFYICFHGA